MSASTSQPESIATKDGVAFTLRQIYCPICETDNTDFVGWRGGRFHRNHSGAATRIVRCTTCGLFYPQPFPFPVDHNQLYGDPESYFEDHNPVTKLHDYQKLIRAAQQRSGRSDLRVLDIGSGRGELVVAANREGVKEVVGLEFAAAMVRYAKEHHGVTLRRTTLEDYAATHSEPFDLIVMNGILEHVYDPNSFVMAAARLSAPGTLLYIDVPQEPHLVATVAQLAKRLAGQQVSFNLSPTFPPYHVFGFNPRSLRMLLAKHGFVVQNVRVHAHARVDCGSSVRGRITSTMAALLKHLANLTGTAENMYVWAIRT